ncbi:MAG: hypothetical protein ACXVBX_00405 [Flavisolibacter sp.]
MNKVSILRANRLPEKRVMWMRMVGRVSGEWSVVSKEESMVSLEF